MDEIIARTYTQVYAAALAAGRFPNIADSEARQAVVGMIRLQQDILKNIGVNPLQWWNLDTSSL